MLNRKRSPFSLFPTFSKFCGFLQWDFDLLLGFVIVVVFFLKLSSSAILIFLKLPARLRAQIFHPGPQLFKAQLAQSFRREKRFKNFGSSMTFQRRKKWICESRCQVSDRLQVFGYFFVL